MFKTNTELIVIDAKARKPINTDVVFWSHDHGTAKLIFKLQKDSIPQSLTEGTIVPICLEFDSSTAENGRGRHIYHAEIVDVVNGIVSIVLEDNILGYVGRVDGSIYIELPDSRSLDTAGRFTFDIKRSPIDENVPELEDYYWQGFNEIMTQYHETIATIKLEAKTLLDSLTADVTKVKNDITTANTRIAEINQKIDDNDVFTKQESSANVIFQLIGKEKVQITFRTDFTDKIAGTDERIHRAWIKEYATVTAPSEWLTKIPDNQMGKIESLDNDAYTIAGATNLNICQIGQEYNLVIVLTQLLGEQFFIDRGATSPSQKVEVIRSIIKKIESSVWGSGSGVGGYKLTMNRASNINGLFSSWIQAESHQNSTYSKVSATLQTAGQFETAINPNGWFRQVVYANQSDGTTKSQVFMDYACMDITIEISANEHIKSTIATNHVQNLATQTEAEAGTDNSKSMTPLGTAQQIEKKAVTVASNQTIGGIKNFKDGLMVNGDNIVGINDRSLLSISPTNVSIFADGSGTFIKHGAMVIVQGSVKFKQAVSYGSLITNALPTEFSATFNNGIIVGHSTSNSAKSMYVERGTTNIKANSNFDANEWFTFNGIYWTGEGE